MSELTTARARIREAMVNTMDHVETRELVGKIESAVDAGYKVDEETLEEYVGEIIGAREEEAEAL